MASTPKRSHGSYWDRQNDVEVVFQVGSNHHDRSPSSLSPLGPQHHAYSNEALVDGDEYFSDQMEYEEPPSQRRNRERPLGASPVHRNQAEAEQRRLLGKSMPQLTESSQVTGPGRAFRQHRYEVIPPGPPRYSSSPPSAPAPAPPPPRPIKPAQTPTPPRHSTSVSSTTPNRTPSNASQLSHLRRQGSEQRSAHGVPLSATSHPKMAVFLTNTSITPRRNLTPLMNSMSPQRSSERRPPRPQNLAHRRSLSMSSSSSKLKTTAVVAPSTYKSFDLEGFPYDSPHGVHRELEADMAQLTAELIASHNRWKSQGGMDYPRKSTSTSPSAHPASMTVTSLALDSSSPVSAKKLSWIPGGVATRHSPRQIACLVLCCALCLLLAGVFSAVMAFYLLAQKGRTYYLDFGVLASFSNMMLGALGLRVRAARKVPHRNFIMAYLLMVSLSAANVIAMLVIILAPPPTWVGVNATITGTPLVDIAGGVVCGTSALTLLLMGTGFFLAYCSNYPPPDNRVGSCSPGFTI